MMKKLKIKKRGEQYFTLLNEYEKKPDIKKCEYIIIFDEDIKTNYDFDRYIIKHYKK